VVIIIKCKCEEYGPTVLRIALGLLFLITGLGKLMAPSGIIGMLGQMSMPAPALLGWLVILSEVILGLTLIVGYEVYCLA